jgi:hypothetical protein
MILPAALLLAALAAAAPVLALSGFQDEIVTGRWRFEQPQRFTEDVTVEGEIVNGRVPRLVLSVGQETAEDVIPVTIAVQDMNGDTIAASFFLHLWLADAAEGAVTATAPDQDTTVEGGTLFSEYVADTHMSVLTGSDGTVVINVDDDDADNDWYLRALVDGRVYTSAAVSHAAP